MKRAERAVRRRNRNVFRRDLPFLVIERTNRHVRSQLVDKATGQVLAAVADAGLSGSGLTRAHALGRTMGIVMGLQGVWACRSDTSWYRYHGRVKAFFTAVRAGGIRV